MKLQFVPVFSMSLVLYTVTFLILISPFKINAKSAYGHHLQKRHMSQFFEMAQTVIGGNPLIFYGYGCWCGPGGAGEPIDAIDACCKAHDLCYDAITLDRLNILVCGTYVSVYQWELDSQTKLPICKDTPNTCLRRLCECDRIVTTCFKQTRQAYKESAKCPAN